MSKTRSQAVGEPALRLRAYLICLALALCLHIFRQALAGSGYALLAGIPFVAALLIYIFLPGRHSGYPWLREVVGGAALTALVFPLASLVASSPTVPEALRAEAIWPQALVCIFASRALAELCEENFIRFWRDPARKGSAATQSMLAALLLGCGLTLGFYQLTGSIDIDALRVDPGAIVLRALFGETGLHAAVILLFFVVAAAILDAALLMQNEATALEALKRIARERSMSGGPAMALLPEVELRPYEHTRVLEWFREESAPRHSETQAAGTSSPLQRFHNTSRRMIRVLLSFLPLAGFLGTVIGLTAAMKGILPDSSGVSERGIDIASGFAGLALKFETTLLGLAGALIAAFLLAMLERREGEIAAGCTHLKRSLAQGDNDG